MGNFIDPSGQTHSYDPGYPEEYDEPEICFVCGGDDATCDCEACPVCASVGDPKCIDEKHMTAAHDSIQSLIDHQKISDNLRDNFRATDRHSPTRESLILVFKDGSKINSASLEDRTKVAEYPTWLRIDKVKIYCEWDAEFSDYNFIFDETVSAGNDWVELDDLGQDLSDAWDEWNAEESAAEKLEEAK